MYTEYLDQVDSAKTVIPPNKNIIYICNLFFMLIDNNCWCFLYVEACTIQFVYTIKMLQ